jgi:hypothetical protein
MILPACCAPAASGHAATVPPSNVMNSRRFMGCPSGSIGLQQDNTAASFESRHGGTPRGLEYAKQSRERGPENRRCDEDHRGKRANAFQASWGSRLWRAAQALSSSFAHASRFRFSEPLLTSFAPFQTSKLKRYDAVSLAWGTTESRSAGNGRAAGVDGGNRDAKEFQRYDGGG